MTDSLFIGKPSEHQKRVAEKLGHASFLLATHPGGEERGMVRFSNILLAAIYHEQIRFFFDQAGLPFAFVIWAFPSPPVQQMLVEQPEYVLHESEWDEGGALWIMECVVRPGYFRSVIAGMKNEVLGREKIIRFVHRKTNMRRVVTWVRN